MARLLLTESLLQDCDVLLECLDLKAKDALLIARVIGVALQLLSQLFLLGLELLVLAGQGGDLAVGLVLELLRSLAVAAEVELQVVEFPASSIQLPLRLF